MKRTLAIALLALSTAASASAAPLTFFAFLDGPSEQPPVSSPGTGSTLVTIDAVANTMRVEVVFKNLIGTTTVAHIHTPTAVPGTGTAGVATQVPRFVGFPVGVKRGVYDVTFDMTLASSYNPSFLSNAVNQGSTATAQASLFSGIESGRAYLNVHSSMYPGGEIRGFLQPCGTRNSTACPSVPEPASMTLVGLALAGLAAGRRLRRR